MATTEERRRRGQDIIKKYRPICGGDTYAAAADAIADILMFVAESEDEARQIAHAAEIDYRTAKESEDFIAEG
jgi:hypothetical protein